MLVATILSAQCTDERVNKVTGPLFKRYRSAQEFAKADRAELEGIIRSTGFFRAKANNIIRCAQVLVERHGGEVPTTMDELTQLAGVGRKTANVVLGNFFGIAVGIVVDTHVKRLSERLGLTKESDPVRVEADLMELLPEKYWIDTGNLLILHGRKTCGARKPKCADCRLSDLCPSATKFGAAKPAKRAGRAP